MLMFEVFTSVVVILPLLIVIAYFTLFERYLLATFQFRVGPDLWLMGLLQPIIDGVKLFLKQKVYSFS